MISLPLWKNKNIRAYYLLGIFLNGWFILPNWMFYFARYLNRTQIGITEGVAILTGLLMEIPTGAFADLFGKKTSLITACLFMISGFISFLFAKNIWLFLLGNTLLFIGFAFKSGSLEAFAYDSLKETGQENHFSKITSTWTTIAVVSTVTSTLLGGIIYAVKPEHTMTASILTLIIAVLIIITTHEPAIDSIKITWKNSIRQLVMGFRQIFSRKMGNIIYTLIGFIIIVKLYEGMVRQSTGEFFGFNGETFSYLLSAVTIPVAILSSQLPKILTRLKHIRLLQIMLLSLVVAFIIPFLTNNSSAGIFVVFFIMLSDIMSTPIASVVTNAQIESKYRATALSSLSFIGQIPYVVLVFCFAEVTQIGQIKILYGCLLGIILLTLLTTLLPYRQEQI